MVKRMFSAALMIVAVAFSAFVVGSQIGTGLFTAAADTMKPLLVSIIGTPDVTVANNASNPVPVKDVDNPARHPVQFGTTLFIDEGELGESGVAFNVSVGKQLVIEYLAAGVSVPTGQSLILWFVTTLDGSNQTYPIVLSLQGTFGQFDSSSDTLAGTQLMRVYVDPGTQVSVFAERSSDTGLGVALLTFSGYLVDVP